MNSQTLADALGRLIAKEADYVLDKSIETLCMRGFIQAGTFIIDSTDLLTTEKKSNKFGLSLNARPNFLTGFNI